MAHQTDSTGIVLPQEISSQIWQDAVAASVAMQRATPINLPAAGVTIPLLTGEPTASWTGEGQKIGVTEETFGSKTIQGQKVGVIELFSNEFKRDLPGLYAALAERLPKTIGKAFDARVFHGTSLPTGFDGLAGAQEKGFAAATAYDDLVEIDSTVFDADGVTDAWVVAPRARRDLISAKDDNGNPLLLSSLVDGRNVPSLLGADVEYAKAVYAAATETDDEVLGYAGQWEGNAFYGVVDQISVAVSTESSIEVSEGNVVHLFQQDMFALRVTAHLGFAVRDLSKFVKVTGEAATGA